MSQPSPFPSTRHGLFMSHPTGDSGNSGLSESLAGFGLVAGILQAKVQQARGKLQSTTAPFEPLVAHLDERIETLEKQLIVVVGEAVQPSRPLQNAVETSSSGEDAVHGTRGDGTRGDGHDDLEPFVPTPDDCEERLARIETKLKLWKLLQSDLMHHP